MEIDIKVPVGIIRQGEDFPYEEEATLHVQPGREAGNMELRLGLGETFTINIKELQRAMAIVRLEQRG